MTPLHLAASSFGQSNVVDVVNLLISHGAEINIKDDLVKLKLICIVNMPHPRAYVFCICSANISNYYLVDHNYKDVKVVNRYSCNYCRKLNAIVG